MHIIKVTKIDLLSNFLQLILSFSFFLIYFCFEIFFIANDDFISMERAATVFKGILSCPYISLF